MTLWIDNPHWWQYVIFCGSMIGALSLGYGIKRPSYAYKFLVGCSYSVPFLAFGFTWWMLVVPVGFIVLFKLSNSPVFAKMFAWKICEFSFGALIGITAASFIPQHEWLMILLMGAGGVLFAAGGTHIDKIGGQKWVRRYTFPILMTAVLTVLKRRT